MPPGTAAEGGEKARRAKLFVQTKSFQTTDKPTFLARGGFVSSLRARLFTTVLFFFFFFFAFFSFLKIT